MLASFIIVFFRPSFLDFLNFQGPKVVKEVWTWPASRASLPVCLRTGPARPILDGRSVVLVCSISRAGLHVPTRPPTCKKTCWDNEWSRTYTTHCPSTSFYLYSRQVNWILNSFFLMQHYNLYECPGNPLSFFEGAY